ncbi:MAG: type II toxin-antitoxin system HicB family antitoxin [Chloroflexota bacterium]
MKKEFTATIERRGKWYVGWVDSVPGANTQGRTIREVEENLEEAVSLVLETQQELAETNPPEKVIQRKILVEV